MQMKQCANGHFYDASKTAACPYCQPAAAPAYQQPRPQAAPASSGADGSTVPVYGAPAPAASHAASVGEKTVAVLRNETDVDPVVGWLVCVEGSKKGRDFRLHAENNFVGRDPSMDVCIMDETVSRTNHAIISYDIKDGVFYFSAAEGRSIIRLNGEALFGTAKLKANDELVIGASTFRFVPFCGKDLYAWE